MSQHQSRSDARVSMEHLLLDFAHRLGKGHDGRVAIHLHLSELRAYYQQMHYRKVALRIFEFLTQQSDGQAFLMGNGDFVFVSKAEDAALIDDAVTNMRRLFSTDPLAQAIDAGEGDRFCTWYDLGRQYDAFLALAQRFQEEEDERCKKLAAKVEARPAPRALQPLDAHHLGGILDAIACADLSNFLRRQQICALAPGEPPKPVCTSLSLSIDDLRAAVLPDYDLASDRWLFQHLTHTLDDRMLQLLMKGGEKALAGSFSLNLNVATLMSDRFLAFDAGLRPALRGTIVAELRMIDVFADLNAYYFARDFAQERGYRVCLDGVTPLTLPFVDRERLGLDLVKLAWERDSFPDIGARELSKMSERVAAFGPGRTVLCHCDGAEAIATGHALGINLFQGRHVDRLLAGKARVPVPFDAPAPQSPLESRASAR